jgi:hypothetical protein
LSRHGDKLPCVDIFVCTADLRSEPPSLVVSAVLSVMAYSYPADKLSVYLSDDGCSALTFYAVWEASRFAKLWLPFCRRHSIEPRSPAAYFSETDDKLRAGALCSAEEWSLVKVNTVSLQYCMLSFHLDRLFLGWVPLVLPPSSRQSSRGLQMQ